MFFVEVGYGALGLFADTRTLCFLSKLAIANPFCRHLEGLLLRLDLPIQVLHHLRHLGVVPVVRRLASADGDGALVGLLAAADNFREVEHRSAGVLSLDDIAASYSSLQCLRAAATDLRLLQDEACVIVDSRPSRRTTIWAILKEVESLTHTQASI